MLQTWTWNASFQYFRTSTPTTVPVSFHTSARITHHSYQEKYKNWKTTYAQTSRRFSRSMTSIVTLTFKARTGLSCHAMYLYQLIKSLLSIPKLQVGHESYERTHVHTNWAVWIALGYIPIHSCLSHPLHWELLGISFNILIHYTVTYILLRPPPPSSDLHHLSDNHQVTRVSYTSHVLALSCPQPYWSSCSHSSLLTLFVKKKKF